LRDIVELLRDRWTSEGIALPPGATLSQIDEFEARHGVRLPLDMIRYFRAFNGMGARGPMDSSLYSFWDLASVASVLDEFDSPAVLEFLPDARDFFVFADHAIGSQSICINLANANNTVICIWGHTRFTGDLIIPICDTFTSAIESYLARKVPFV
jgi:hypothetical protein